VTADLDETGCFGEVNGGIADRGEEDGIDEFVVPEILEDGHSFLLWGCAVNKRSFEVFGVHL